MNKVWPLPGTLCRILRNSSDVASEAVREYLLHLATDADNFEELIADTIFDFTALSNLPPELVVEFIQKIAIDEVNVFPTHVLEARPSSFGIRDLGMFSPPSAIHPPFLQMLSINEKYGLNLIGSLVTVALRRWRWMCKAKCLTPVPIFLKTRTFRRCFWGDVSVYLWFRHFGQAPAAVRSALMALEVWADAQIKLGHYPSLVFEKVLSTSGSVANLGICLSIGFQNFEKCFEAILPLLCYARVWKMDTARFLLEQAHPYDKQHLFKNSELGNISSQIDKQINRLVHIRLIAPYYAFSSIKDVRETFERNVSYFEQSPLALEFSEQLSDKKAIDELRVQYKTFSAYAGRNNYDVIRLDDGNVQIQVRLPPEAAEELAASQFKGQPLMEALDIETLCNLANEDGQRLSKEDCAAIYKRMVLLLGRKHELDSTEVEFIEKASVSLALYFLKHEEDSVLAEWSMDRLLEYSDGTEGNKFQVYCSLSFLPAVGGIGMLMSIRKINFPLQSRTIQLVKAGEIQILHALLTGMDSSCWKYNGPFISDCLMFACKQAGLKFVETKDQKLVSDSIIVEMDKSFSQIDFEYVRELLARFPIPYEDEFPQYCELLVSLSRALVTWTLRLYSLSDNFANTPIEWSWACGLTRWLSRLLPFMQPQEAYELIRNLSCITVKQSPRFVSAFLESILLYGILPASANRINSRVVWQMLTEIAISRTDLCSYQERDYLPRNLHELVTYLFLIPSTSSLPQTLDWSYVADFEDEIDKVAKFIGRNKMAYSILLSLLFSAGTRFNLVKVLNWIRDSLQAENIKSDHSLISETSTVLLKLFNSKKNELLNSYELRNEFISLVGLVSEGGAPSALILHRFLIDETNAT